MSLEYEYAKNLYKMGMEQTIVMDKMSQTFPFLDILQVKTTLNPSSRGEFRGGVGGWFFHLSKNEVVV